MAVESTWWPGVASFEGAWARRVTHTAWADTVPIDAMRVEEVVALLPDSAL